MDMWKPYIAATQEMVPDAEKKIVYDRFHIAAHLNDAVSEVRRAEHARLSKEGNTSLKNSRNIFRKSAANMTDKEIKGYVFFKGKISSSPCEERYWRVAQHLHITHMVALKRLQSTNLILFSVDV